MNPPRPALVKDSNYTDCQKKHNIFQGALSQAKICTCALSLYNGQIIQSYITPEIFTDHAFQDNLREGIDPVISSSHMNELPLERWQ